MQDILASFLLFFWWDDIGKSIVLKNRYCCSFAAFSNNKSHFYVLFYE